MNLLSTLRPVIPAREKQYVTREGDMVDRLCYDHYGSYAMIFLRAVFRRNPNLADYALPRLPAGMRIVLPVLTAAEEAVIRQYKQWPMFSLIGDNIPKTVTETKKPASFYEVAPTKVREALAAIRRKRKVTRIPFYDEPPRTLVNTGDPFVQMMLEPVAGEESLPPSESIAEDDVSDSLQGVNEPVGTTGDTEWPQWLYQPEDPDYELAPWYLL